eukprot:1046007-Lingulodinium_polyedra.AAC.1
MVVRPEMSHPGHARGQLLRMSLALGTTGLRSSWPCDGDGATVDAGGSDRARMNGFTSTSHSRLMLNRTGRH